MEQPLCHLYFLTFLEHLWSRNFSTDSNRGSNKVYSFTELAGFVLKNLENARGGEAILLRVELQAVVQALIHHLANCLDPEQTQRLGDFQNNIKELNE
jgi:hypothetical protein